MENETPNFLNPQSSQPMYQMPQQPMAPQMPQMPSMGAKRGSGKLLWIILALAVVAGGAAWWYIGQMGGSPLVVEQPKVDQDAHEDATLNGEIQSVDVGNLDAEFQPVDKDINSL
jgi:uncharacterized protein HemX